MEDKGIKFIPDWRDKNLMCHFCGETRSVKYTMKVLVIDPLLGTDRIEVPCCKRVLPHDIIGAVCDKELADGCYISLGIRPY